MSVNARQQASQFCRLFAKQDCNTPIDITTFGFFKFGTTPTATAAGQADGGGIPLTSSRANGLEVNADTGSTALGGDYYVSAIKGNLVHGTADTNSSQIGVLGVLNNNTATFGSGDKYAVRGHLDLWGITNLTGANVNVGAVSAYVENEAVPVVDSGNVLCGLQSYQVTYKPTVGSGVYPARGMNPALWIRASAAAASWQTGIYMPVNSVETAIRVGNWVGSGASGSAIPFATAQNVYADGQLDLVAVFGESTSDLGGGYSAKCGRFRHIATGTALTVSQETYGLIGQMCVKGTTLTHLHAGLMGTFEGTGASVVCNSSYTTGAHAAVIARVGGHTNITATTPLAGFLAFNNGSAALASGTLSAFATSVRSTTYPWDYGLYVPAATANIPIGIGEKSSSAAIGHHLTVTSPRAIQAFSDDGNAVLGVDTEGINSRLLWLHHQTGAYTSIAMRGHLRIAGANWIPSESKCASGVCGYVECDGTYTVGNTNFTILAAVDATVELGGTPTIASNAVVCGIHVAGKTLPASPTGESIGVLFQAISQGYEHAFGFSGVGSTDGCGLSASSSGALTKTHAIAVWINGVGTRYIQVGTIA